MQKLTISRLGNLARVGGVTLLTCLLADVGKGQGSIPSGTFQFTTGSYSVSSSEGAPPQDTSLSPSLLGARVTVTRTGGATGRVLVPYSGLASGTLVFDDYQMSASILVNGAGKVTLGTPTLDPLESPDLMPPTLGGTKAETINVLAAGSDPTNSVINLERATFRVDKNTANAIIHVSRTPNGPPPTVPDQGVTVNYTINPVANSYFPQSGFAGNPTPGNTFALEAGSDYAVAGSDFIATPPGTLTGVVSFPSGVFDETITIPITNNALVEFDMDLQFALWIPFGSTEPALVGGVDHATLTILPDSFTPGLQPAGAVDRTWNKDNSDGYDSNPPYLQYPGTKGGVSDTANGNGGTVYAAVEQPDGKAIIAGSFNSFDSHPYNRIVRLMANGYQDPTFLVSPNSGANGAINAMALQPDGKIIIGGNFTSFNGANRYHIARLNSDGTVDATFMPGTGANGAVYAVVLQNNGQIVIGGNFTSVNGMSLPSVARLNADGSLDASFYPGTGPNGVVNAVAVDSSGRIVIGGDFDSVSGSDYGGLARLNADGSLDMTFNSGIGTYNPVSGFTDPVNALAMQGNMILVGGGFAYMELAKYNGLVRLNSDGTIDTTFNSGTGTYNPNTGLVDSIFAITLQPDGEILIGGDFTTYNQTRRLGIARLFSYGSLDTSFMDTAYNQFAGLINHYHNPDAVNTNDYPQGNNRNFVSAIAVEPTLPNNVIIGGSFLRVGGGSVYHSGVYDMPANSGIFDNARMDIHPRSNVARLIGGVTPGPGNISLMYGSYSADKSAGTLYVSLARTNGSLGVISATCLPEYETPGPGIATTNDVIGGGTPTWPTLYSISPTRSWTVAPGTLGPNFLYDPTYGALAPNPDVVFNIIYDTKITGNLNADIDLLAPDGSSFRLGGELIPLGTALGFQSLSPLTVIDTNIKPGTFGFSSPTYTVNQGTIATITVIRGNGSDGTVQINYGATNGTAISPTNYTSVSGTLTFGPGVTNMTFTVPTATGTTTNADKTVNLRLSSVTSGGTIGLTNAVLTVVNNTFSAGHIAFTTPTLTANENTGTTLVTVDRLGGSTGTLDVTAIVAGGTAVNGVNYVGSTNALHWNNGDISVKTISIPLIDDGIYTSNLLVNLALINGLLNSQANGTVLGLSSATNATLAIINVDFPGIVEFSSGLYSVNKSAGYALIPVIRTGGSAQKVSVNFSTRNGSATNGLNYTATNGVLAFTNGEVAKFLKVPILDDGHMDGLLALNLVLSNAVVLNNALPWNALGTQSNAVLNIIDTDSVNEPPGSIDTTYSSFAGCNGNVYVLASQINNQLIVGGDFSMAAGVPRQRLARLNSDGSLDASFLLPSLTTGADGQISALAIQADGRIVVGGSFRNFSNVAQSRITRLNYDGSLDSTFNSGSGADNSVFAVAQQPADGKVLVAGAFATLNGVTFNGLGRLNSDGTPDATFNTGGLGAGSTGTSATVYAVAIQSDGKIIIGGDFTTFNGVTVNHLARLNTDGSLDAAFSAGTGANDSVRAIAIQLDGKILIGGRFTNYDTLAFNHVARLNADGTTDGGFIPGVGANDMVSSIALQSDGCIVLGGQFTRCNGVTRNGLTRLNSNGTADPTINFGSGANGLVAAVIVQEDTIQGYPASVPDEKIIIGGAFSQYNGQPHASIARIFGGSVSGSGAFEFSSANYEVDETNLFASITVVRTGGAGGTNADGSGDILVPFATSSGTASNGVNYANIITNIDFPAGEVEETILIPVLDDHAITPNLTVNLALNPLPPAEYGNQPTAVLTIVNDDSSVEFSTATYQVPKNVVNGLATIDVFRVGSASGTASVIFGTTTNGTAVAGTDYTPVTSTLLSFNPGVTNVIVTIPIINNNLPEGNTTIGMAISNPVNTVLSSRSNALLTIIDTVVAPGQLAFIAPNFTADVSQGTVYLPVSRIDGSSGSVSVIYNLIAGTAQPGVNYVAASGTLTFQPGVTTQSVPVQLVNSGIVQGPVSLTVALSNPSGGATLSGPSSATLTILNNNAFVGFTLATNTVPETAGVLNVTVVRSNSTNIVSTVQYATTNGTAVAGVNYSNTAGTLTFGIGVVSESIAIPLINQSNITDLAFGVNLSSPAGAYLVTPSKTVVILQGSAAGVSFSTDGSAVLKTAASASFAVVCSNPRVEPVGHGKIPLQVTYTTVDGSARAGINYLGATGTLVFTNGLATNTFTVLINNNQSSDLTFAVNLTSVTAPGRITPYGTQTVVIAQSNVGDNKLYIAPTNVSITPNSQWITTLAVTNYGPSLSSNVVISDVLPVPSRVALLSSNSSIPSASVAIVGTTLTWNVGNLAVNGGGTLTLNFQANTSGIYSNTATVSAGTPDPFPNNNSALAIANVSGTSPPAIAPHLAAGAFQLSVTNDGGTLVIIQSSTNLILWLPVYTNFAPFTFTDANVTNFTRRFYRALLSQ